MGRGFASSAVLSLALHGALAAGVVFAPQVFRGPYRPLPDLGAIVVSLEGSGGPVQIPAAAKRPAPAPLPEKPAPPEKAAPAKAPPPEPKPVPQAKAAPPPARPSPADDLTLPTKAKAPPPRPEPKPVEDDLRPDFRPIVRQDRPASRPPAAPPAPRPTPAPAPEAAPAPQGPQVASIAPGPRQAAPSPGGAGPSVDISRRTPGGTGGEGTGADPLLYYFARIQDKVGAFWMPAAQVGREIQVLVGIRVMHTGQVREITIDASSGDPTFDDAAIRALRQALPLPPFPPLVKENSMTLILKFTTVGLGG